MAKHLIPNLVLVLSVALCPSPTLSGTNDTPEAAVVSAFRDVCLEFADQPKKVAAAAKARNWALIGKESTKKLLRGAPGAAWLIIRKGEKNRIIFLYRLTGSCGIQHDNIDPKAVMDIVRSELKIQSFSPIKKKQNFEMAEFRVDHQGLLAGLLRTTSNFSSERLSGSLNFVSVAALKAGKARVTLQKLENSN